MPYYCSICKKKISEKVFNYSSQHFGKALCFHHQREVLPERFYCSFCKEKISEKVYDYSMRKFGKALCIKHQKDFRHRETHISETTTQHNKRYYCSQCKKAITSKEYNYSMKYFDESLCYGCQPEKNDTISVPPSKRELNRPTGIETGGKQPKKKMYHDGY